MRHLHGPIGHIKPLFGTPNVASRSLGPIRNIYVPSGMARPVPSIYPIANELREFDPVPTHELFTKLGFWAHPKPGLVHWLPLGLEILNKLKALIHRRMQEAGAEETSLSLMSHSSLWEQTGRWNNPELFKLKDSSDAEYCLAATCEEEITHLVKQNLTSYKELPMLFYQIKEKFRDEKRPRSGLLRGREFIMKDAYSFDVDETGAMATYDKMVGAYVNIFSDLRVPFVKAVADSGAIGGSLLHEWHYLDPSGEDSLFACDGCGHTSNIEKTLSFPQNGVLDLEVAVKYFKTTDSSTLVCAYYPKKREFQPKFLKEEISDVDLEATNETAILEEFSDEGLMISKKIVRVMDSRLNLRSNFPDFPIPFINRSLMTTLTDIPMVLAEEGELCHRCEDGTLQVSRAIEVGHTFYLGDKYTLVLDCTVDVPSTEDKGKMETRPVIMGCYGIGISRIVAAIGHINRDSRGFMWPAAIAPWEVTVVGRGRSDPNLQAVCDGLLAHGVDCRLDNRPGLGLGHRIALSERTGIPMSVIVGNKWPLVEIEVRGKFYNERPKWKEIVGETDFEWRVEETEEGGTKHYVDASGVGTVVSALLRDM